MFRADFCFESTQILTAASFEQSLLPVSGRNRQSTSPVNLLRDTTLGVSILTCPHEQRDRTSLVETRIVDRDREILHVYEEAAPRKRYIVVQ